MRKRNNKGQFEREYSKNNYNGYKIYYDKKGYPVVWLNGKDSKVHILVWEKKNGTKPKGYDIHHKDYNKKNYSLRNLKLLTHSDHQRVHANWIMKNGEWIAKPCTICKKILPLNNFYQRVTLKHKTPNGTCKKCYSSFHKQKLKDDSKYRERKRLYLKSYSKRLVKRL